MRHVRTTSLISARGATRRRRQRAISPARRKEVGVGSARISGDSVADADKARQASPGTISSNPRKCCARAREAPNLLTANQVKASSSQVRTPRHRDVTAQAAGVGGSAGAEDAFESRALARRACLGVPIALACARKPFHPSENAMTPTAARATARQLLATAGAATNALANAGRPAAVVIQRVADGGVRHRHRSR